MKAIVLHGGGLDSTVCLLLAQEAGREAISLGIDYGQRHRLELEYALNQCNAPQVERRMLRVEWDKPQRNLPTNRSVEQIRTDISPAFCLGAMLCFLLLHAQKQLVLLLTKFGSV